MSLDPGQALALTGAMLALAAVPDASALAVVARALASGVAQALVVVLGILVADFLFVALALYSLAAIADATAGWFSLIKVIGAVYLLWMAWRMWRAPLAGESVVGVPESAWSANFLCGLAITLGDPKAIFFYLSFLPAYIELGAVTHFDTGLVMLCVVVAVGGVKTLYAVLADRARLVFRRPAARRAIQRLAALVMLFTVLLLLLDA